MSGQDIADGGFPQGFRTKNSQKKGIRQIRKCGSIEMTSDHRKKAEVPLGKQPPDNGIEKRDAKGKSRKEPRGN